VLKYFFDDDKYFYYMRIPFFFHLKDLDIYSTFSIEQAGCCFTNRAPVYVIEQHATAFVPIIVSRPSKVPQNARSQ
jgi:hypothetical protein